jgi:DNA-binding transcriptional LysR family regulator
MSDAYRMETQLRRPVTPTEPGARLLEHAEPILLRLDAARADVTRMTKTPPNATLLIGVTPLAGATSALPTALAALRVQMPRPTVNGSPATALADTLTHG